MDAEDEESPLQQHSHAFPHLSTTSPQCHTAGEEAVHAATTTATQVNDTEVVGEVEAAVVAADTGEAFEEVAVETEIGDSTNGGDTGVQVMEDKVVGDEVVEDDDGEKRNEEDEIMAEGTDLGDVAGVEEDETRLAAEDAIGDGEDKVEVPNEAALMEGREEGQEKEQEHEDEEEADTDGGKVNEAALIEGHEQEQEQEEADVGGGIANEAALIEEHEEGQEEQEQEQEQEEADTGGGIANEAAMMEEHEEGQEREEEEQEEEEEEADGGGGIANEAAVTEEEEHEEGQEQEEEEADGGGGGMGEDTEEAEEQSRSVSGGKRKRGSGKNSKSTGRVPSRKKMEEDVCFICFDGGELVLCDRR